MTRAKMIKNVPVLTLRDVVVYPHMVIPLFVGRDKSILALDEPSSGKWTSYRWDRFARRARGFGRNGRQDPHESRNLWNL